MTEPKPDGTRTSTPADEPTAEFDIVTYRTGDHATRHRSTAAKAHDADPHLVDSIETEIRREGYAIAPDVVDPAAIADLKQHVEPLFVHDGGRNAFEGFTTRRLYSPLDETDVLDQIVEHPLVLAVMDRLLKPNYLLSQLQVIDIGPGEQAQHLHPDDGFYPNPRPRSALSVAIIVAVDAFTADNGATVVIPNSHRWDDHLPTPAETATAIEAQMTPGSILFFLGTAWHGGGANQTNRSRMCVTAQYCQPWCRTQENFSLSVTIPRAARSSDNMQRLLGYSIHPPFMGFVNGMHPKRLLDVTE